MASNQIEDYWQQAIREIERERPARSLDSDADDDDQTPDENEVRFSSDLIRSSDSIH